MSENSKRPVSTDLTQNIEEMEFYFHYCADIKKKQMKIGRNQDTACGHGNVRTRRDFKILKWTDKG